MTDDPAGLARSILDSVKAGMPEQAVAPSKALVAATQPGERLRLVAVEPLALAGLVDEAATLCDEVAEAEPGAVQPLRLKAQLANRSKRDDLLADPLSKLFALARNVPDLNWIADSVEAAGWQDLPADELHAKLVGAPMAGASVAFALLLVMLDRPEDARPHLDSINSQAFNNPDVLIASAIVYGVAGDVQRAQSYTGKALQLRPTVYLQSEGGEASMLVVTDLILGHFSEPHRRLGARAYMSGNFPSEIVPGRLNIHLLQLQTNALDRAIERLANIDVVLANLSWAGAEPTDEAVETFDRLVRRLDAAALNHPRDHMAMSREANYRRWAEAPEFIFPKTVRDQIMDGDIDAAVARIEAAFDYPIIIRPSMTQIGDGMVLVDNADDLAGTLADLKRRRFHVIQYHETNSEGGYYRKYRAAVIDGLPIPFRIDTRPHWMVHRQKNAPDYFVPPEAIEEEVAMQQDWKGTLSSATVAAIERIAREAPLDIFGIDFGHTADGEVVIYEANAMMNLIPYRFARDHAHFGPMAAQLQAAIEDAVIRRKR